MELARLLNSLGKFWHGRSLQLNFQARWQRLTKNIATYFTLGVGLSLVIAACNTNPVSTTTPIEKPTSAPSPVAQNLTLRIGHQKFDPLTLVKNKGNLETRVKPLGVTAIKWTEFQSGPPMLEALNAKSIDIARTGDAPPVVAQAGNVPLLYVGGSLPKHKSSAVLVKQDSPVQTIADLKGKTVALAKGSSAQYLLVKVLELGGLKWEDIKPVYLSPADARAAFEQNNIDAWAIWDPFYALAQVKADARVVRDSQGLVANRDFFLSTKDFADRYPDIIKAIQAETQEVSKWASTHPSEVAEFLSPLLKIDKPILETVTKRRDYGFESVTPEMVAEQQAIADSFYKLKLIPKAIKVADAIWQSPSASGK